MFTQGPLEPAPAAVKQARTLCDAIDAAIETWATRPFLIRADGEESLSYRALGERLGTVGAHLSGLGLRPGDRIALGLENGVATAEILLALLHGGFVAVPLDVRAGRALVRETLAQTGARVLLAAPADLDRIGDATAADPSLRIVPAHPDDGADWPQAVRRGTQEGFAAQRPAPEDAALLNFTSGTSGRAKGVLHAQEQVLAGAWVAADAHSLRARDRALCVLPLCHINAQSSILLPTLLTGGSVVLPQRFDRARYWEWVARHECTWLPLVPAIVAQLLASSSCALPAPATASVRFARSSSAPLPAAQHRAFEARFGIPLFEMMGATEAAGILFSNPVPGRTGETGEDCARKIGSIGIPRGVEARIVDPKGSPLPTGATGEIAIRSPRLLTRYYGHADASSLPRTPDGFLRTGDLGHCDAEGYFFVTGRCKEIVIKGGTNIAPREIDDLLAQHPSVLEAAAVGVPERWFGETIVAFVVPNPTEIWNEQELLDFCERELGVLRTPDRIGTLSKLPRGATGKLQRLRLREAGLKLLASPKSSPSPASRTLPQIERDICRAWAAALGLPRVDRGGDFFALGGYSLLALQLIARLQRQSGIRLELGDFLAHPTPARLAIRAAERTAAAEFSEPAPILDSPPGDAPLSRGQERLWWLERLGAESSPYNEARALRLRGRLRVDLLEESLQKIHARHAILRVEIEERDGSPRQRIRNDRPFVLERLERGQSLLAVGDTELRDLVARRFDLSTDTLIRATLVRTGEDDHVLLLCLHHIVCDTWSFDILFRELEALYSALAVGEPPLLPPLSLQFTDFAHWELEQADRKPSEAALEYWRDQIGGAQASPGLPADRPRVEPASGRGAIAKTRLGAATTLALRAFAQREGATFFMLLVAILQTLMHRWTGRDDLLLGSALTRRTHAALEPLIGYFVDTQVLRAELSDDPVFLELLARTRTRVADAIAHPLHFDELVAALRPERSVGQTPFIEMMLNYRDLPRHVPALANLRVESIEVHNGAAKFDLTLSLVGGADELEIQAEYATDRFDATTIERWLSSFEHLADAVVEDPARRLSALPLLGEEEIPRILQMGCGPRIEYPRDASIPDLFAAVAARAPDAIAASFGGEALRYGDLQARANQLAHRLQALGVGPDGLVGVALERSPDLLVALVGILAAGGAYVPIDTADPPERLALLLEDSGVRVIVTQEQHAQAIREGLRRARDAAARCVLLRLDRDADEIGRLPTVAAPRRSLTAEHLAYVLYTSGSTGVPKGVCVSHRAVVRLVTTARYVQLGPEEVLLQYAPLAFDASTFEIWGALLSGASLAVFPPRLGSLDELGRFIEDSGVTTLWLTAGLFQGVVDTQLERLHGVRQLLSGGDVLSLPHVRKIREKRPDLTLVNGYGPTEATVFTCCHVVDAETLTGPRVPIGRPIANAEVLVLDGRRRAVPVGVAGELYIGGEGLARGYLNAPALDAERFVAHPTSPGQRLFRSGDLARWRTDGTLDFLGRNDAQVKVRGFRIEPAEIEAALGAHPAVREAAVTVREGDAGEKELVACVVFAGAAAEPEELRRFLAGSLPARLVPRAVISLPALPLTANGKLDRRALAKLAPARSAKSDPVAPRNDLEEQIAKLFGSALGEEQVGIYDDFFALGGHSLLAARLHSRLTRTLGIDLPFSAFFQAPSVAGLAERFLEIGPEVAGPNAIRLTPEGANPPLFCVHGLPDIRDLARYLGPEQPLYGLAQDYDGSTLARSIEDVAERYLTDLRNVQPKGPYSLIGYSVGGLIAFEMARRLRRQGEEIRILALVDPSKIREPSQGRARNHKRQARHRPGRSMRRLGDRGIELVVGIHRKLGRPLPPRLRAAYLKRIVYGRVYPRAARHYTSLVYPGRILLFIAEDRNPAFEARWSRIAEGGIEVHRIPGQHRDLLKERGIRMIAQQLAPRLESLPR